MGLLSALRFLHVVMGSGAVGNLTRPGMVDTEYFKAKARPQLWPALSWRRSTTMTQTRAGPTSRMRDMQAEEDSAERSRKLMRGTTTPTTTTAETTDGTAAAAGTTR